MTEQLPTILDQHGNPVNASARTPFEILSDDKEGGEINNEPVAEVIGSEEIIQKQAEINAVRTRRNERINTINRTEVVDQIIEFYVNNADSDQAFILEKMTEFIDESGAEDSENNESTEANQSEAKGELKKLIEMIPRVIPIETLKKIDQLSEKDPAKYTKESLREKKQQIVSALCEPLKNGHLTAKDIESLAGRIEIISAANPPENLKDVIDKMKNDSGYEGVLFVGGGKIYIFEEALTDTYVLPDGTKMNLDFKHMISHEMSHEVVGRTLLEDKKLVGQAVEIIEKAEELGPSQSQHIQNVLVGLRGVMRNYDQLSDDEKAPFGSQQKYETYQQKRKIHAAKEILADYSALYLQTNGNEKDPTKRLENFVLNCAKTACNGNGGEVAFAQSLGITPEELKVAKEESDPAKKFQILREAPNFGRVISIYKVFFDSLENHFAENKGNFNALEKDDEEDLELDLDLEHGYNLFENPIGFKADNNGKGQKGQSTSFLKDLGDFVKAFAEETGGKMMPGYEK